MFDFQDTFRAYDYDVGNTIWKTTRAGANGLNAMNIAPAQCCGARLIGSAVIGSVYGISPVPASGFKGVDEAHYCISYANQGITFFVGEVETCPIPLWESQEFVQLDVGLAEKLCFVVSPQAIKEKEVRERAAGKYTTYDAIPPELLNPPPIPVNYIYPDTTSGVVKSIYWVNWVSQPIYPKKDEVWIFIGNNAQSHDLEHALADWEKRGRCDRLYTRTGLYNLNYNQQRLNLFIVKGK